MGKMIYSDNKTLKLDNVLKYKIPIEQEDQELSIAIDQMQSYIRAKGAIQIGPLIQYTNFEITTTGEMQMNLVLMLQCNTFLHSVTSPYVMEAVVRVPNAVYCRYQGPKNMMQLVYQKIQVEAFERNISLRDDNYTVFVGENSDTETVTVDVFMPKKH